MPVGAIVGYDGSPAASAAIDAGALLFPDARGWITYLWGPPFASPKVRARLWPLTHDVTELIQMIEREGEREAQRLVAMGVTLARAAGWDVEPLVRQTWGSEGLLAPTPRNHRSPHNWCAGPGYVWGANLRDPSPSRTAAPPTSGTATSMPMCPYPSTDGSTSVHWPANLPAPPEQ